MGKKTAIEWCHHTFNPWFGCVRVSDGCLHCYAETFDKRIGGRHWGPAKTTERRFFGEKHWREPLKWNAEAQAAGERRRVFCSSMADVFEDNASLVDERTRLFALIEQTPWLDWLLLTKRPENLRTMLPTAWLETPRPNVWLGTSVENQAYAEPRIEALLAVEAVVHFLSCEPLIGPLDLEEWLGQTDIYVPATSSFGPTEMTGDGIDWVIVGGESGPTHRPLDPDWARSLRDQCQDAGVAFHFKQHGGRFHSEGGRLLDGREWNDFPEPRAAAA